jgi:hypothetical protein
LVCLNQPAGIFREERAARRGLPCRRGGGIRGQGRPDLGEGIADLQDLTDWEQLPEKAARLGFDLEAGLAGHQHRDGCAGRNRGAIRDTPLDQAGAIVASHGARNHNASERGHQDSPRGLRTSWRID